MSSKLFLVCPFSCMEPYIQRAYGLDVLFITAMGAVLQPQDEVYLASVRNIIKREKITSLYIVNDLHCNFIYNTIKRQTTFDTLAEKVLGDIYVDNFMSFENLTEQAQKARLAEFNINNQAKEIMKPTFFGKEIIENNITIKGLITSKKENQCYEIIINQYDPNK